MSSPYKIGFRVEKDGKLELLWDSGPMFHGAEYSKLRTALVAIHAATAPGALYENAALHAVAAEGLAEQHDRDSGGR